jgi:hypothetical protein
MTLPGADAADHERGRNGQRMLSDAGVVLVLVAIGTCLLLGSMGCGLGVEHTCSSGEYPVIRGDGAGGSCVMDGAEPTGANVRFPAEKVPDLADEFYSPTLANYLRYGDERQQQIAREQLDRLIVDNPDKTREDILRGPIFPGGYPSDERP